MMKSIEASFILRDLITNYSQQFGGNMGMDEHRLIEALRMGSESLSANMPLWTYTAAEE